MDIFILNEYRCNCGKLLFKGIFFDGTLEIKCKKCGTISKINRVKLIDDVNQYLLIVNKQGLVINFSDSACKILGYSNDELLGKEVTRLSPSLSLELGKKFFKQESILNKDNYFQINTVHVTKDGLNVPVTIRFKLYKFTSDEKYVLLLVKLKNGLNVEKNLTKDKSKFLDNACDFYFYLDKTGIGQCISESVEKLLSLSQESIIGKNYFDFLSDETKLESKKFFNYFSALEQPYREICSIGRDANNKVINNELYFTPTFDDYGKFCGYCVLGWLLKDD
ncbi:MAG: PAS domain S-box protein [Patescibacteria group bacterium]|nr:PAS domain S-box protein [Patescibacteria group bacterium]